MKSTLDQLTLYRGIYSRVARKLGVDPSYVSRVARGERTSPAVTAALQSEIQKIDSKKRPAARSAAKTKKSR